MQRVTTQAHEGIETEDELVAYQKAAAVTTQAHEGIEMPQLKTSTPLLLTKKVPDPSKNRGACLERGASTRPGKKV